MKPPQLLVLITIVLLPILLPACGPSQAELDATATLVAANTFTTQTAEAPTATPTFTPTPTATATPTHTATAMPTATPVPPTATATDTPTPTATITPSPTAKPRPRPTLTPGSPPAPVPPVQTVMLLPGEWTSLLPLGGPGCVMNAFKESETLSGYVCFVNSQAVGAAEPVMLMYILRTCPATAPCPQAKPNMVVSNKPDGSHDLTAGALGYMLDISVTTGDAELARQALTAIANLQFEKIRRGG
jgi:hypothetical protein